MRSSDSLGPPTLVWPLQAWCALGAPNNPRALPFGPATTNAQAFVPYGADPSAPQYLILILLYPSYPCFPAMRSSPLTLI